MSNVRPQKKDFMPRKPPVEERRIILTRDTRRRYGSRVIFRVLHPLHIGALENVSFLLQDGTFGTIRPISDPGWTPGFRYEMTVESFAAAAEAELAGMQVAQALLLTALDLDFGIRLDYSNHSPVTVYDRTVSALEMTSPSGLVGWPETTILEKLTDALHEPVRDRKLTLSMELLASSYLEVNDRAKFIMAVSSLEPLAASQELGSEVNAFVSSALANLQSDRTIPDSLRPSLEGRIQQLRKESVRQSLMRHCERWFPGQQVAVEYIGYVYRLRSEILHDGAVADPDILLAKEIPKVRLYVRHIYEQEFNRKFWAATAA